MTAPRSPRSRADVNRANSQHSTGPTSANGKARSAQNSGDEPASLSEAKTPWAHGLYSQQLILPVDELAQSFWRLRRFRELEARAWTPEQLNSSIDCGMMALIRRSATSAERSFHKTLAALQELQKRTGREPAPRQ